MKSGSLLNNQDSMESKAVFLFVAQKNPGEPHDLITPEVMDGFR